MSVSQFGLELIISFLKLYGNLNSYRKPPWTVEIKETMDGNPLFLKSKRVKLSNLQSFRFLP